MQKIEFIKCGTLHGSTPSTKSNAIEMEKEKTLTYVTANV